jgi:hypothetical protein
MDNNITNEDELLIIELLKGKLTHKSIAEKFETDISVIENISRKYRAKCRKEKLPMDWAVTTTQQIKDLFAKGCTRSEIKKILGVTGQAVQYALGKAPRIPVVDAGQTFGRLTVLGISSKDKYSTKKYLCSCSCGQQYIARHDTLVSGRARSCGCIRKEGRYAPEFVKKPSSQRTSLEIILKVHKAFKIDQCGASIFEICARFKISASTYYRLRKEAIRSEDEKARLL